LDGHESLDSLDAVAEAIVDRVIEAASHGKPRTNRKDRETRCDDREVAYGQPGAK